MLTRDCLQLTMPYRLNSVDVPHRLTVSPSNFLKGSDELKSLGCFRMSQCERPMYLDTDVSVLIEAKLCPIFVKLVP